MDTLISSYAIEEQIYSAPINLSNLHSFQAFLQHDVAEEEEQERATEDIEHESLLEENTTITNPANTQTTPLSTIGETPQAKDDKNDVFQSEVDISDIPKLGTKRKPTAVSLLPEFAEYSVQNAILILMRRRPDLHMHIDAIVRDIYGDLPAKLLKAAKINVSKALSTGVAQKMWYRVLGTNGVYTLHYEKGVTAR